MHVGIVGGTGFTGGYLIDALLAAGHSVAALVRAGSENKLRHAEQVQVIAGNIDDKEALKALFSNADAAIYNVGILREAPRKGITYESTQYQGAVDAIDAAKEAGVSRLLVMSANGVKKPGTRYQETKFRADEYALKSGMDTTVIRPSVIFGDPRGTGEFGTQLRDDMVRPPIPAVNFFSGFNPKSGPIVIAPVHVEDVASAFLAALEDESTYGKTYELGGPEILTWKQMISRVASAVGRNKWFIPMPIPLMRLAATLFDWIPIFPVTREQLTMLEEGNVADPAILESLTRRAPKPFNNGNLSYLNHL